MITCKDATFAGLGDLVCKVGNVNGGILEKKGTTYTDSTFVSLSTRHTNIASKTLASRVSFILDFEGGFEPTTDDPNITTSNLGVKYMDGKPIPSAIGYLNVGQCDYASFASWENQLWDLTLTTDELNTHIGTRKADLSIKGFRVRIAFVNGLPKVGAGQQNYPVHIFFMSSDEFKKGVYAKPGYMLSDLRDYVPAGLSLSVTTAYTTGTGTMVVRVVKRGTNTGHTGLLAAAFPVRSSVATPQPVGVTTLAEIGGGDYTLTIQKDTGGEPASLAVNDTFILQAEADDATYQTYVSNLSEQTVLV